MEENANVVVKLLIRRPECFGPALRGEGGQGLLVAMKEAIKISEDPTLDLPKIREGVNAGYVIPKSLTLYSAVGVDHPAFEHLESDFSAPERLDFLRKLKKIVRNCQVKISTLCVAVLARKEKLSTWATPSCLSTRL